MNNNTNINQIKVEETFFKDKYSRNIQTDVATILRENEIIKNEINDSIKFSLYGWNGKVLTVQEKSDDNGEIYCSLQKQIDKIENGYTFHPSAVATDIILMNKERQLVSLADGSLFIKKEKQYISNKEERIMIQQPTYHFEESFCRIAYFSYENQANPEQNYQYIIGVRYDSSVVKYSNKNLNQFYMEVIKDLSFYFVQYDEINQVLLGICQDRNSKELFLQYFKINQKTFALESQQIIFNNEDLEKIGIHNIENFKSMDFQYSHSNEQFNIFIFGNKIGIFTCGLKDIDQNDGDLIANIEFIFDPFSFREVKDCNKSFLKLFSDKRNQKFDQQELTMIYDKVIIKLYPKKDVFKVLTNLRNLKDPYWTELHDNDYLFQKYFCLYGSNNISYHILTYSNSHSIHDQVNEKNTRIYVKKEI